MKQLSKSGRKKKQTEAQLPSTKGGSGCRDDDVRKRNGLVGRAGGGGGGDKVADDNVVVDGVRRSDDVVWRHPTLWDGTKVPLSESGRRDDGDGVGVGIGSAKNDDGVDESFVELSLSFCRDILSSGTGGGREAASVRARAKAAAGDLLLDGAIDNGVDGKSNGRASSFSSAGCARDFFCVLYAAKPKSAAAGATLSETYTSDEDDDDDDEDEEGDNRNDAEDPGSERYASAPKGFLELGRTEVISTHSTSPIFKTKFITSYHFCLDSIHEIIVVLRTAGSRRILVRTTFCLERIICSAGLCESSPILHSVGGSIVLKARTLDEHVVFCLSGRDLKKRGGAVIKKKKKAKNPYIVISHEIQNSKVSIAAIGNKGDTNETASSWRDLWKSEVYRDGEDDTDHFGFGRISFSKVGRRPSAQIRVMVFDWDYKNQSFKLVGQVDTTIHDLTNIPKLEVFKKGRHTGNLVVRYADVLNVPNMAHYLRGGMALDLMVALDFTSSNGGAGDPNSQDCLHRTCLRRNKYQLALRRIGEAFGKVKGADLRHEAWGFGAIDADGQLQHRFPLGEEGGTCVGADGLLGVYGVALRSGITLSSPKLLRPSLDSAIERALQNSQRSPSYSVLVVLCSDGKIGDLTETIEKLTQASYVPLSVVFIGVGGGVFSSLRALARTGRGAALESLSGNDRLRDVANFVKLDDYHDDADRFVRDALRKIPSQFTQYHVKNSVFPSDDLMREAQGESMMLTQSPSNNSRDRPAVGKKSKYAAELLQLDFVSLHNSMSPTPSP